MHIVILIPIVYLAAVAETALGDVMRVGEATPDLIALVAVVWLLTAAGPRAFLIAGGVALLGDLIAPGRLGVGMAWMLAVGYGVSWLRTRLNSDHLVVQVPIACAALIAWAAGVAITGRLLGDVALPLSTLLTRAAATGLYTAAVAVPALMVVGWIREPLLVRKGRLET